MASKKNNTFISQPTKPVAKFADEKKRRRPGKKEQAAESASAETASDEAPVEETPADAAPAEDPAEETTAPEQADQTDAAAGNEQPTEEVPSEEAPAVVTAAPGEAELMDANEPTAEPASAPARLAPHVTEAIRETICGCVREPEQAAPLVSQALAGIADGKVVSLWSVKAGESFEIRVDRSPLTGTSDVSSYLRRRYASSGTLLALINKTVEHAELKRRRG